MRDLFAYAAQRQMGVYSAVDVDTPGANPQELVRRLPESARFEASGRTATMPRSPRRLWPSVRKLVSHDQDQVIRRLAGSIEASRPDVRGIGFRRHLETRPIRGG